MATARRTRCQLAADYQAAVAAWPDDMPHEAQQFEQLGWDYAMGDAPRCDDPNCCTCHG